MKKFKVIPPMDSDIKRLRQQAESPTVPIEDLLQQKHAQQQWLKPVIAQGIAGLMALRLKGAPSEDLATKTAEIWLLAISHKNIWLESIDKARFQHGFIRLYADCDSFPCPKMLLDRLPPQATIEEEKASSLPQKVVQENEQKLTNLLKSTGKNHA